MMTKEFSSYFIFDELSKEALDEISALTKKFDFEIEFDSKFLEFEYSGWNPLNVIKYFYLLAKIVKNADGELKCEIMNDDGDNDYEFYRIEKGKLIFQPGKIVRGSEEIIEIE